MTPNDITPIIPVIHWNYELWFYKLVMFADISEGYWWYDQEVITNLPIALEMSLLRQRRKPVAQIVTELDAFPKVPETYVEQTATGAYGKIKFHYIFFNLILFWSVAIITFFLVVLMLYSEMNYYFWPGLKFRFAPDSDMNAKLKFNVDMTVAMPCDCE